MSVLIKGMDMPRTCDECNFGYDGKCFARKFFPDMRTGECPLVEIADAPKVIEAEE